MTTAERVVFLLDVDDTLLDNDTAQNDYLDHIARRSATSFIASSVLGGCASADS